MSIYQLNDYQEEVLRKNAAGQVYVLNVAKEGDDTVIANLFTEHTSHIEALVNEKLMKEISTEEDQFIQQMKAKHDREYRAFKLTPLAIAMFSPVLVQGSKHGTYRNAANTIH